MEALEAQGRDGRQIKFPRSGTVRSKRSWRCSRLRSVHALDPVLELVARWITPISRRIRAKITRYARVYAWHVSHTFANRRTLVLVLCNFFFFFLPGIFLLCTFFLSSPINWFGYITKFFFFFLGITVVRCNVSDQFSKDSIILWNNVESFIDFTNKIYKEVFKNSLNSINGFSMEKNFGRIIVIKWCYKYKTYQPNIPSNIAWYSSINKLHSHNDFEITQCAK